MARLTDNSSFPVLQDAVLQFWAWWRNELAAAAAPIVRVLGSKASKGATVRLSRGGPGDAAGERFAATLEPESWRALAGSLQVAGRRRQPLVLDLAPDLTLTRSARYPAGALAKLDDIIALDVEKSTPFTRESAVWKWRVVGKAKGQVEVETVILRRDLVLSVLSLASDNGLEVGEIVVAGGEGRRALQLMKLDTAVDRARGRWRRLNTALAALVVLAICATAVTVQWQRDAALAEVTARLDAAKARAIRLRRAQAEAIEQYDSSAALLREKARTPSVNAVWNALSATLPDTVFLSGLELSGKAGRISGFARSAAPLIEMLEGLDELSGVAFASPVMINPDDKLERFDITFKLEAGPRDLAAATGAGAGVGVGVGGVTHD